MMGMFIGLRVDASRLMNQAITVGGAGGLTFSQRRVTWLGQPLKWSMP